ncbi:3-oxoacyl-[acyl-carrier-protein] synthase, mitochondrial [Glycine soja]
MSGDAYHITQPPSDGKGAILAMTRALRQGAIGHLLGAAGAVEAIFVVLAIRHGIAPLTPNLTKPNPVFGDGFMPLSALEEMPIRVAMSQSVLNVIRYLPYSLRKVKKKKKNVCLSRLLRLIMIFILYVL